MKDKKTRPPVFAISGVKNSGKTTLITRLIPVFAQKGLRVATIKHDGHSFQPDVPGTDSYCHRAAGAVGTAVFSENLMMVVKETACTEKDLLEIFSDADLILLEGFKGSDYPKMEIIRDGNSEESVCNPENLVAILTDKKDTGGLGAEIPVLDLNQPERIADVILEYIRNGAIWKKQV